MSATTTSTHLRGDDKIKIEAHKASGNGNEAWLDIICGQNTFVIFCSIEQAEKIGRDILNAFAEIKNPA